MKPLFTVHAGEYLVGGTIERKFPDWNVWLPSKDTGTDLLVTNQSNTKAVSIQVKFSKDYNPDHGTPLIRENLRARGWWTHDLRKIEHSSADFWVFVIQSFFEKQMAYIIIRPEELLRRLVAIHGRNRTRTQSYLDITKNDRCWETRGISKKHLELVAESKFDDARRDFTPFLDNWKPIQSVLK